jgi:predicted site-specific integrase-resolvase
MKKHSPAKKSPDETSIDFDRKFRKAKPLAERFGVCRKTLFRWADAGLISRHKINSRVVLFDATEVETFVRRCRVA